MSLNEKTAVWDEHTFVRVYKKQYDNFIRYFKNKIEGNYFMGWYDHYDWSLNNNLEVTKNTPQDVALDNLEKCMVARHYCETPRPEYWIRLDYIEANKYDLNTIVPKPRKKRMTKAQKALADHLCDIFDYVFMNMYK